VTVTRCVDSVLVSYEYTFAVKIDKGGIRVRLASVTRRERPGLKRPYNSVLVWRAGDKKPIPHRMLPTEAVVVEVLTYVNKGVQYKEPRYEEEP
jgi:hypothetical protein